jgi:hypothetical protein
MKMVTIDDLTPYHRGKIFHRARAWRLLHHDKILALLRVKHSELPPKPGPPTGAAIFDPARWEGYHWLWFSQQVITPHINRQRL